MYKWMNSKALVCGGGWRRISTSRRSFFAYFEGHNRLDGVVMHIEVECLGCYKLRYSGLKVSSTSRRTRA